MWATLLTKLTTALRIRSSNAITQLKTWSLPLVDLTTRFSQLAPDFAITTFFETVDTYGVRVVPEGSARLGQRNERTIGLIGNHLQICRFEDEMDPNYRRVIQRFKAEAEDVLEHEQIPESTLSSMRHYASLGNRRDMENLEDHGAAGD